MNKKGRHTHFLKHYHRWNSSNFYSGIYNFIIFFNFRLIKAKKKRSFIKDLFSWALRDSNPRPSGCKPDALNQLS